MSCSTCNDQITNSLCGCGTSCPPRFEPCIRGGLHCPPPPPIMPCGYRQEDGRPVPVWHSVHPLIPMLKRCYGSDLGDKCGLDDDEFEREIACGLRAAELTISHCKYRGEKYYHALIYQMLANRELKRLYSDYNAMQLAAGFEAKTTSPFVLSIENTYWGQRLKELCQSSNAVTIFAA
jgi:hypothetical protein